MAARRDSSFRETLTYRAVLAPLVRIHPLWRWCARAFDCDCANARRTAEHLEVAALSLHPALRILLRYWTLIVSCSQRPTNSSSQC